MQDELARAEPGGDPGGGVVGVDVAHDALLVAGERGHDRHLAADEEAVQEVAPDPGHVATRPTSGIRSPMSSPPSTPDRPTASQPTSRSAATSSS